MKVKIEGLKELESALGEFSKATARGILKRALTKAAKPIAEHAQRLAPVDTGALRTSIKVSARMKNNVGKAEYSDVMRGGGTREEAVGALRSARRAAAGSGSFAIIAVGPAVPTPHAHLVEFGTSKMAAKPYLRPAWEAEKDHALASVAGELRSEIDKAAARAARKAARLARKG